MSVKMMIFGKESFPMKNSAERCYKLHYGQAISEKFGEGYSVKTSWATEEVFNTAICGVECEVLFNGNYERAKACSVIYPDD